MTSSNKVTQSIIIPVTHPTMIPTDESLSLFKSRDLLIVDVIVVDKFDESQQPSLLTSHDLVITGVIDTLNGSQSVLLLLASYISVIFIGTVTVCRSDETLSPGDPIVPIVVAVGTSDVGILMVLEVYFVLLIVSNITVDLITVFCDVTRSVIILDEVVSVVLSIKPAILVVITTLLMAVTTALDRIIVSMCRVVVEAVNGITTVLCIMVFTVAIIAGDVLGVVDTSVGQEISITNIAKMISSSYIVTVGTADISVLITSTYTH